MKKYLLATTCAIALSGAAGGVAQAAPPVPMQVWGGPYLGINLGVARSNATCTPGADGAYGYYSCGYGYGNGMTNSDTGAVLGLHGGYDFQDGSFVYGGVVDWSWTSLNRTRTAASYSFKAQVDWLASFRGRMGMAFDRNLFYITGGLALAQLQGQGTEGVNPVYSPLNKTQLGWVAGVGFEHKFSRGPGWSFSTEFLYYDFGNAVGSPTVYSTETYKNNYTFEIFEARLGLNYRF